MKGIMNIRICLLTAMLMISAVANATHYRSKAVAYAKPASAEGRVWVGVDKGTDSQGWFNPDSEGYNGMAYDRTDKGSSATYKYNFYVNDDDVAANGYTFVGWFSQEDTTAVGSLKTRSQSFSENISSVKNQSEDAVNKTYWAYWKANTYTIAFDGNGKTKGSVASISATYDQNVTLAANGYRKHQYIVTYNTDGGSAVSPDSTLYSFLGWNTQVDGNGTNYSTGATLTKPNFTSTQGDTYTLYAKWSATVASSSVTLPTSTKSGYQLEGWYNGDVDDPENKVGDAGDPYTPSDNVTLTAHWIEKWDLDITCNCDTIKNESWTQANAFTFTHADNPTVHIEHDDIISYNPYTNTLRGLKIGTSKIYFTQGYSETVNIGTTTEWTITVDSVANTLAVSGTSFTKYVDQDITSLCSGQNSNGTITTTSSNENLAYYDIDDNTIYIPNSDAQTLPFDDVTITISQAATTKYKFKKHTITLTVQKYPTSFTGSAYNSLKVDDEQTADYTYTNTSASKPTASSDDNFYYTIDNISYTNSSKNKQYNDLDSLVRFNTNDKLITALNAGTGKITFHQKETKKYTGATTSFDVTISKYDNTLYANGSASYSTSTYVDRTLDSIQLTATNTDYANWPISVTPTAGSAIIASTYNEETRKISLESNHNLGTATWAIHQDENYKYNAGNGSFSVRVIREAEATNCYVLANQSSTEYDWHGNTAHEHTWTYEHSAGVVTFEISKNSGADQGYKVQQYLNGEWVDVTGYKNDHSTSWGDWKSETLNRDAKGVRFALKGGSLNYVRNVSVKRALYLEADDTVRVTKTAANNPIYPNDVAGFHTIGIRYSIANGGNFKVTNDNSSKFTLSKTSFTASDCSADSVTINVTYNPTRDGNDTAHLVVYNTVYRDTVVVIGTCVKRNQSGKWKENISTLTKDTRVIKPFSSTQSGSYGVTYTSTDSTKVDISGDTIIAKAEGSATIYAEVRGDENYYPIRESIDITVTTDHVQYIVWNQDRELRRLKTTDSTFTLNAYATSDIDTCITNGPDAENPRPITYAVIDDDDEAGTAVTVSGNILTILRKGKAKVRATQAGGAEDENGDGHTYIPVSMTMDVIVRDPSDTCERYSIYTRDEQTRYTHGKKWQTSYSDEFSLGGETPGFYSMVYKGENGNDTDPEGTITMQEYVGGEWSDVNSGTPRIATYDTIRGRLDPTATKIRVKIDGKGYLYFKEIDVKRIDYIEVQEGGSATDTLVFSSYIGTPLSKDVIVRSSNVSRHARITLPTGAPFTLSVADIDPRCENDKIDTTELSIEFNTLVGQTDSCYNMVLSDGVTTKTIVLKATATAETVTFGDDGDWTEDDGNWSKIPNENTIATISDSVNVVISTEVEVYSLMVEEGATVTVTPTGGLTIGAGGIIGAAKDSIKIQVSTDGGTKGESGYVRISPEYKGEMPQATIETYTKGFMNTSTGTVTWQYLGSPIAGDTAASKVFGDKTFIYTWDESKGKWVNRKSKMKLEPFKGYAVSQSVDGDGKKITYDGQLVDMRDSVVIELQYTPGSKAAGCNVLANSFAAPIDISRLTAADFSEGVEATINLFNTGSQSDIENCIKAGSVNVAAAGQYLSIPVNNAKRMYSMDSYPIVIPPMQGFYVNTNKAGTLTLNYERLVWNADYEKYGNQPLRAKRRTAKAEEEEDEEDDLSGTLKVTLLTESGVDHMYILESPTNVPEYENGYDARKLMSGNLNIFAVEEEEQLAIDATNSLIGTKIGVRTGNDSEFKMAFSKVNSESNLSLLDKEIGTEIAIYEGMEYTFYAVPNETITDRFEIVDRFNSPAITTGNDGVGAEVNVQKFIKDNSLYIYKDGALYNALGERVR